MITFYLASGKATSTWWKPLPARRSKMASDLPAPTNPQATMVVCPRCKGSGMGYDCGRPYECDACSGAGRIVGQPALGVVCPVCKGRGRGREYDDPNDPRIGERLANLCTACSGTGRVASETPGEPGFMNYANDPLG